MTKISNDASNAISDAYKNSLNLRNNVIHPGNNVIRHPGRTFIGKNTSTDQGITFIVCADNMSPSSYVRQDSPYTQIYRVISLNARQIRGITINSLILINVSIEEIKDRKPESWVAIENACATFNTKPVEVEV